MHGVTMKFTEVSNKLYKIRKERIFT